MLQVTNTPASDRRRGANSDVGGYSTPFCHADEAWFWAVASLAARHEGCRSASSGSIRRPCDPCDVLKCLDQLYQKGSVGLSHARVLMKWGNRRLAPSAHHATEATEAGVWREAMAYLEPSLRKSGIVA